MGGEPSTTRRTLCSYQAWGLLSLVLVVTVLSIFDFEAFTGRVGQVRSARHRTIAIDRVPSETRLCPLLPVLITERGVSLGALCVEHGSAIDVLIQTFCFILISIWIEAG